MLLPRISPKYIPRRDHEHVLSRVKGLSSEACALTLETQKPAIEAFQLLEVGRGVMAGLTIESQADISILKEHDLQLYQRYESLRYEMSTIQSDTTNPLFENKSQDPNQRSPFYIEQDLEKVENEIRKTPGFTTFQLPPSDEELRNMADDGPIVAFNVTKRRCDALIITKSGVRSLALKDLSYLEAENRIHKISQLPAKRHPSVLKENNQEMKDLLRWLWFSAVKPVLEDLSFLSEHPLQNHALPRIWWITNGILGCAPLHAAGIYDGIERENAMEYVVSSYTSTIKALKFTRAKLQKQRAEPQASALLISATDENLDFGEEIQVIKGVISKYYKTVSMEDKSREEVLHQLECSSIIHFACHGFSIGFEPSSNPPKSPSDSYLLLRSADGEKLTVDDLVKVRHSRAQLAYLSACSTAEISAEQLVDETIHIANAFQLAGYPHVIGTLWEAEDESAMMISKAFYESLFGALDKPWHNNVANALHQAVRTLMQDNWFKDDFLAWTPFIHIGA
ncbi:hypothetical protein ABW20_dc0109031 [Dactylellina cionopaga]|nr:hypothetical protein ABW20_dc0109031 [Dactylellina cionopaga]